PSSLECQADKLAVKAANCLGMEGLRLCDASLPALAMQRDQHVERARRFISGGGFFNAESRKSFQRPQPSVKVIPVAGAQAGEIRVPRVAFQSNEWTYIQLVLRRRPTAARQVTRQELGRGGFTTELRTLNDMRCTIQPIAKCVQHLVLEPA